MRDRRLPLRAMDFDWRKAMGAARATPRREALVVGCAVAAAYWMLRLGVPKVFGAFHDDAVYAALGQAIADGHGYRSIYAVGAPVHLKYPPGLPVWFAVLWWVGRSLPVVAWLAASASVMVSAAAAGVVWWIARAKLGLHPWIALVWAVGPFLFDSALLYFSLPISEPYFVLGWATCLVATYRLRERPAARHAVTLGLIVACASLVRTQAIVFIPALAIALLIDRVPWRATATFVIASVTPVLTWAAYHARLVSAGPLSTQPDEGAYLSWIPHHPTALATFAASAVRVNWGAYWFQFSRYLSGVPAVGAGMLAAALALAVAGGVLGLRRHAPLTLTCAASATVVLLWPWPQDRFVFSSLPFAGLLIGTALHQALRQVTPRLRTLSHLAVAALVISIAGRQTTMRPFAYLPISPRAVFGIPYPGHFLAANTRFVLVISRWILGHTSPNDRILVDAPAGIYLYTGRQTVSALPAQSELMPSPFAVRGRYLISRILDDSVSVVVLTDIRHPLAADVALVFRDCPGMLQYAGSAEWWEGGTSAFFYRVMRRDGCGGERGPDGP